MVPIIYGDSGGNGPMAGKYILETMAICSWSIFTEDRVGRAIPERMVSAFAYSSLD